MNDYNKRASVMPRLSVQRQVHSRIIYGMVAILALAVLRCDYDAPLTAKPTRKVEPRLLGNWTSSDGKDRMKVRTYDNSIYVISYNGILLRAYHSDFAAGSFITVQDIEQPTRKYLYVRWRLSGGGDSLSLETVKDKLVSKNTPDSATVMKLIRENLSNPELFGDVQRFTRDQERA